MTLDLMSKYYSIELCIYLFKILIDSMQAKTRLAGGQRSMGDETTIRQLSQSGSQPAKQSVSQSIRQAVERVGGRLLIGMLMLGLSTSKRRVY